MSLDAKSLYTNVPLHRVKESINRRYSTITKYTQIPFDELRIATTLLMNNDFIRSDNSYDQQTYGCEMGSPISF